MLPLIANVLPTTPAVPTQNAPANASLLLAASTDAGAAARQLLPNAVMATGAPVAYFPGTAPQRQVQMQTQSADRTLRVPVPPPTGDFIEVQQPAMQTAAAARFSVPVTLGIPLTTQLTAQFMAQQATANAVQQTESYFQPRDEKSAATPGRNKEPSFGSARGASAYSIAAARSAIIDAVPEDAPQVAAEVEAI